MTSLKVNRIAHRTLNGESTPIYKRLESDLRNRIKSGEWPVGAMIFGRQRLSEEYAVHIRTIDRAIKALVDDGILETQGTRGTFVARVPVSASDVRCADLVQSRGFMKGAAPNRLFMAGLLTTDNPLSNDTEAIIRSYENVFSQIGGNVTYIKRATPGHGLMSLEITVEALLAQGCSAIVVFNYNYGPPLVEELGAMIGDLAIPVVHVTSTSINRPIWNVYYDSIGAGFQAASHVLDKGARSILYIANTHFKWADERLAGIESAMRQVGLDSTRLRVRFENSSDENDLLHIDAARRAARDEFVDGIPDAVIAVNDHMAEGVLLAGKDCGLIAGSDYLLIGFDDGPTARLQGITSMRSPLEELGAVAAHLTRRALDGDPSCQRVCLSSHLIARPSTNGVFNHQGGH